MLFRSALVGSVLLFAGTRRDLRAGQAGKVLVARTAVPILASGLAGLVAVVTVASLSDAWTNFWELWAYRWLATATAMSVLTALFSWLGFPALLLGVPLVFYQAVVGGALVPPAAAPAWLAWLGSAPFHEATIGLRTLLIGGPPDTVPWYPLTAYSAGAIVAVWIGVVLWSVRGRGGG